MTSANNKKLAEAFYAPLILHSSYRSKSLRQAAAKLGKHIIVYEGGESSRFDEYAIQLGIDGALRLMSYLGMDTQDISVPYYTCKFIKTSWWIRAKTSGLFQTNVSSRERLKKGDLIGHITDPVRDYKTRIKTSSDGYVIGLNNNPIVYQGDAIVHFGEE